MNSYRSPITILKEYSTKKKIIAVLGVLAAEGLVYFKHGLSYNMLFLSIYSVLMFCMSIEDLDHGSVDYKYEISLLLLSAGYFYIQTEYHSKLMLTGFVISIIFMLIILSIEYFSKRYILGGADIVLFTILGLMIGVYKFFAFIFGVLILMELLKRTKLLSRIKQGYPMIPAIYIISLFFI